jgi:hypothetical protein
MIIDSQYISYDFLIHTLLWFMSFSATKQTAFYGQWCEDGGAFSIRLFSEPVPMRWCDSEENEARVQHVVIALERYCTTTSL